jgi:hypothetical protein
MVGAKRFVIVDLGLSDEFRLEDARVEFDESENQDRGSYHAPP